MLVQVGFDYIPFYAVTESRHNDFIFFPLTRARIAVTT